MSDEKVGFVRMGEVESPKEVKEVGVGMLGYAFMGKAHSNGYLKMPVFFYPPPARPKLVAIAGRTKSAVAEAAKRYGYQTYYTDWRDVIKDDRVQLVDNGLTNDLHRDPSIAAAEAGKHIFCEKPMAMNSREAREMYDAVTRAGVKNLVAYNYRFIPAIMLARQLINEGYLGKDTAVQSRLPAGVDNGPELPSRLEALEEDSRVGRAGRPRKPLDRPRQIPRR